MAAGEIGVGEDDVRRLPAELDADPLDRVRGAAQHQPADRRRPGEGHLVDAGMGDQRRTRPRSARDDLEDPAREAGLGEQRGESERRERRLLGRLQDDSAAGGERGCDLLHGQEQRVVPRRDRSDDADRLVHHDAQRGRRDRVALARRLGRPAGVVVEDPGGLGDVPLRLGQRLADVERLQPGELVGVRADQLGGAGEHPTALVVRRLAATSRPRRTTRARPRRRGRRPLSSMSSMAPICSAVAGSRTAIWAISVIRAPALPEPRRGRCAPHPPCSPRPTGRSRRRRTAARGCRAADRPGARRRDASE